LCHGKLVAPRQFVAEGKGGDDSQRGASWMAHKRATVSYSRPAIANAESSFRPGAKDEDSASTANPLNLRHVATVSWSRSRKDRSQKVEGRAQLQLMMKRRRLLGPAAVSYSRPCQSACLVRKSPIWPLIHGNLVAAPTVTWSRLRRKTAGLATVTWSHKPIVINTYILLPYSLSGSICG
jgi:hypothetical protein